MGILGHFHRHTLRLIAHTLTSHYFQMCISFFSHSPLYLASCNHTPEAWLCFAIFNSTFFVFFLLHIPPSSICILLVYKEQLASGGLVCSTNTCAVLFFAQLRYKPAQSVHIIPDEVFHPCHASVLFYVLKHCHLFQCFLWTGPECVLRT